ncbi:MAG: hypothetical protein HY747_08800 [Elusimicrobia bacterium]|nr:hypothetical protein [Elusimicrobiota bacterium]
METTEILRRFKEFLVNYPEDECDAIWQKQSNFFREFWAKRIMDTKSPDPNEAEIDQIVKILDRNAKGNTRRDEAVARVMVPQGVWRRMFRELRHERTLSGLLNDTLLSTDEQEKVRLIDDLHKKNEGKKNSLTGKSGNVVCAFAAVYDPFKNLSVVSLNDRRKLMEYFKIPGGPDFDKDSPGKKIILSNQVIIDWFKSLGINSSPRTISRFLYAPLVQATWKSGQDPDGTEEPSPDGPAPASEGVAEGKQRHAEHLKMQWMLIKIGHAREKLVWVPSGDRDEKVKREINRPTFKHLADKRECRHWSFGDVVETFEAENRKRSFNTKAMGSLLSGRGVIRGRRCLLFGYC